MARIWEPFPEAHLVLDTARLSPEEASRTIAEMMADG